MAYTGHGGLGVGGEAGRSSLLVAERLLSAADLGNLSNSRFALVEATPNTSIIVSHVVIERTAGNAARDAGDTTPYFVIGFAPSGVGVGAFPISGTYGVFTTGVYYNTISNILPAGAYEYSLGVENYSVNHDAPLVIGATGLVNVPTGTLRVRALYSIL